MKNTVGIGRASRSNIAGEFEPKALNSLSPVDF